MKISVIVPIYNMEKFIARTITYLKAQQEKDIEYLLINDGSTDSTLSIMEDLCRNDKRFNIYTTKNMGYGHACNFGIARATGEYWGIYEPDDTITTDFYSCLKQVAVQNPQADIIKYNGIYRNNNNTYDIVYSWEHNYTEKIIDKNTLKRFWRSHPSVYNGIYRTNFTYNKSITFCETPGASFQDAMFMVSLYYANPSIYIIDSIKYFYTIHNNQSICFIDSKIDYVIQSWKTEFEWIIKNNFKNDNFLQYKIFIQMNSILKKINTDNKKIIQTNYKKIRNEKKCLRSSIPTILDKIKYLLS